MHRHEGSEEREGEGEEPGADSQGGADAAAANQRQRGKKTQEQHQRQRSDAKKPSRKEEDGEQKKSALTTVKESAAPADGGEGGRMRRCKQQVNQPTAVRRPAPQVPTQQQLPQPLARRRQRRLPRSFTPPKEDVERGLRSLTRYPFTDSYSFLHFCRNPHSS
jgi:hypothetical protein